MTHATTVGSSRRLAMRLLMRRPRAMGAGFMVMGAYTHSRLRRMIMGSATEFMLGNG